LAKDEEREGRDFLANARGVFLVLAILLGVTLGLLAPLLGPTLGFSTDSNAYSVSALFWVGGAGLALTIIGGYFNSLNYAHGNVVWPVLPAFVLTQASFLAQWLLARSGAGLWQILGAGVVLSAVGVFVAVWMLRVSHSWLGHLRPLTFRWRAFASLGSSGFWFSLCAVSGLIYVATDRLLISAGFGAEYVPAYRNNFKLCELAVMLINTASLVALPAILRRLLSAARDVQASGRDGLIRLQRIQVVAAVAFGVSFICFNDLFMMWWLGPRYVIPLTWQVAFALNAAFTMSGEMSIQVLPRFEGAALRRAGITCAAAGLLNLGFSYIAMRLGSILGIAAATVVAQTLASAATAVFVCRSVSLEWNTWMARTWLLPAVALLMVTLVRARLAPDSLARVFILGSACIGVTLVSARVLGLRWKTLVDEVARIRTPVRE
jgi:O-antigen/teichoic acid export membrane protein